MTGTAVSFTIPGPCRTKKTSQQLIKISPKGGGRPFQKIIPSKAHEAWFKSALTYVPIIKLKLLRDVDLPIAGDVAVLALFYRDRASGDLLGYEQALADFLQEPIYRMDKRTGKQKLARKGAGVIRDDVQIVSWDGSRLMKDADNPRIEVTIQVVRERATPMELDLAEGQ